MQATDVHYYSRDTNSMVEEFMLLANVSVAKKIYKEFAQCAVLRRHPLPPYSNFDPMLAVCKAYVSIACLLFLHAF